MLATIITITIIIVIIILLLAKWHDDRKYICAGDRRAYLVNPGDNEEEARESANTLAAIAARLDELLVYLKDTYPTSRDIQRLARRFDSQRIAETRENANLTAYTVNKGHVLSMCLRPRNSIVTAKAHVEENKDNIYDINLLMYVAIHEMAHIMSLTEGHTDEFYQHFRFLLSNAIDIGIYEFVDYVDQPTDYCGVLINEKILM